MGLIEYNPYEPGDARDVTRWNNALSSLETESAALDRDNFAQEGLGLDRFAWRPMSQLFTPVQTVTRASSALTSTSYTQLEWSSTTFTSGSFSLTADEGVLFRYRVQASTDATNGGIANGSTVDIRMMVLITSGSPTQLGKLATINVNNASGYHGLFTGFALLMPGSAVSYDYVRLEYKIDAGNFYPHVGLFHGQKFAQVT